RKYSIPYKECHGIGTVVHVAIGNEYAGHILISDLIKPQAKKAIQSLKEIGIKKTVMLTGDTKKVAEQVADELKIDEVYSELLPGDKVSKVEELLSKKEPKENLAFV